MLAENSFLLLLGLAAGTASALAAAAPHLASAVGGDAVAGVGGCIGGYGGVGLFVGAAAACDGAAGAAGRGVAAGISQLRCLYQPQARATLYNRPSLALRGSDGG